MTVKEFMHNRPNRIFIFKMDKDYEIIITGRENYERVWQNSSLDNCEIIRQEEGTYKGRNALILHIEKGDQE